MYLYDEQGQRIGEVELDWVLATEDVAFGTEDYMSNMSM